MESILVLWEEYEEMRQRGKELSAALEGLFYSRRRRKGKALDIDLPCDSAFDARLLEARRRTIRLIKYRRAMPSAADKT